MSLRHSRWDNRPHLDQVDPVVQVAVLHFEMLDHPNNYGTGRRRLYAECGQCVFAWDCAPQVDLVTCDKCKAALARRENLEI